MNFFYENYINKHSQEIFHYRLKRDTSLGWEFPFPEGAMRNISIISKAPVARMLFKAGAQRVSRPAVDSLSEFLTQFAEETAAKAIRIAQHSGRKTVQEEDVKLAVK